MLKLLTPGKLLAVLAIVLLGLIVASWLSNLDVVLGQLGDSPKWSVVLAPRAYFLPLYALEASVILATFWYWRSERKKLLTSRGNELPRRL